MDMPLVKPVRVSAPIPSFRALCEALDLRPMDFFWALRIPEDDWYSKREVPKANGTMRTVHKPHWRIRRIQKRINHRIFSNWGVVSWPDYAFGSIPNPPPGLFEVSPSKDYVASARVHCGSKSFLKIDIKDFFDNVHSDLVLDVCQDFFGFDLFTSRVLTRIFCYKGFLVQGALTSSYLASLVLFNSEYLYVRRLRRKGLRYTRYVDDITISSIKDNYDFSLAKRLIEEMLLDKDLPINSDKMGVEYISSSPVLIHGLRVNFKEPRLPSDEVSRIRASVQNIESLSKQKSYRITHAYRKDFNKCMGRVNKLKRVGHSQYRSLMKRLLKVLPLPSKKDLERAEAMIERLEADYAKKMGTVWYKMRFYRAHERLNILQRSYPRTAILLRKRLSCISHEYEP